MRDFVIEGQDGQDINGARSAGEINRVHMNTVSAKYFQTMGISLLRGHDFAARDDENSPAVVIINESFERRYFTAKTPGNACALEEAPGARSSPSRGTVNTCAMIEDPTPFVYLPLWRKTTKPV